MHTETKHPFDFMKEILDGNPGDYSMGRLSDHAAAQVERMLEHIMSSSENTKQKNRLVSYYAGTLSAQFFFLSFTLLEHGASTEHALHALRNLVLDFNLFLDGREKEAQGKNNERFN